MSGEAVVAKRYARALFEVASGHNAVAETERDLKLVVDLTRENEDFRRLLQFPNIATEDKLDLLRKALQGQVHESVFRTLELLVERGRAELFEALLEEYVAISNEALKQASATVYTPYPLDEAEQQGFAVKFGALTGKTIRIEQVIDKSLIGGVQVRIGDRLYDGSVSGKLDRLQKSLAQSQA